MNFFAYPQFLLEKCSMGNLTGDEIINTSDKVSGCVIATSKGYPHEYKTNSFDHCLVEVFF